MNVLYCALDPNEYNQTSSKEDDGEIALITRKFKRFMQKKWSGGNGTKANESQNKESSIICYENRKPEHMKADFSMLKKKEKKE